MVLTSKHGACSKEETEKNEGCVLIDEASFRSVTAFEEGPLVYALLTRWISSSETAGRTPVSRCDPPDRDCILCRSMYNTCLSTL